MTSQRDHITSLIITAPETRLLAIASHRYNMERILFIMLPLEKIRLRTLQIVPELPKIVGII